MRFFSAMVGAIFLLVIGIQSATAVSAQGGLVEVEAMIPPKASSFKTALSVSPSTRVITQDQTVTYTLTYRSENTSSVPLTLQASWGEDPGLNQTSGTSNSPAVFEYIIGSATPAYGETPAVVDLEAQTITWSIAALPAKEEQQLKFKFRTTQQDLGSKALNAAVTVAAISVKGGPIVKKEISYQFSELAEASSPMGLAFTDINLKLINDERAQVGVTLSQPEATVRLLYGFSPEALDATALLSGVTYEYVFLLSNLKPQTPIYYKVVAETSDQTRYSDIFTFVPATNSLPGLSLPWTIAITQQGTVLRSGLIASESAQLQKLFLQQKDILDVQVSIPDADNIQTVQLQLRPHFFSHLSVQSTSLTQIADTVFSGKLKLPMETGSYELIAKLTDSFGNVSETKLQLIEVKNAITIFDSQTIVPLEKVTVSFFKKNQVTMEYEKISLLQVGSENPTQSDADGIVRMRRVPGEYQLQVRAPGYQARKVSFEVKEEGLELPQVGLELNRNRWLSKLRYNWSKLGK